MRDHNIDVYTMADVSSIEGEAGQFQVSLNQRPRSVDLSKCTGCGECWEHCPVSNVPLPVEPFEPAISLEADDQVTLDEIMERHRDDPAPLLQVLQDVNDAKGYLPRPVLEALSVRLEIPLAEILRVASFYNAFSLEPVGRHIIEVCMGTACFVRGSGLVLERLEDEIGVAAGGTDKDYRFTLQTVRCIGCCALAPAMRIDGVTFGNVKLDRISGILEKFE
jgi:NADH-quinone oxidoreductase subunit E